MALYVGSLTRLACFDQDGDVFVQAKLLVICFCVALLTG